MQEPTNSLRFIEQRSLPVDTHVYQVDDGTLFFHKCSLPQRLYVEWEGEPVWAKLEGGEIDSIASHDNAIYYCMNRVIYKAVFKPPNRIKTEFIRNIFEVDKILRGGLFLQKRENTLLAYRLWDTKGVLIEEEPGDGFALVGIHKGKALYAKYGCEGERTVVQMNESILKITLPNNVRPTLLTRDSWSLIYIENDRMLFTLDTKKMQFLKAMRIEGVDIVCTLKSIRNGILYSMCRGSDKWYLQKAKLPKELIDPVSIAEDQERLLKQMQQQQKRKPPQPQPQITTCLVGPVPRQSRRWNKAFSNAPRIRNQPQVERDEQQPPANIDSFARLLQLAGQEGEANGKTAENDRKERELEEKNRNLVDENEQMKNRISELEKMLEKSKIGASQELL